MAAIVLLTWWSCSAFIPIVATGLAQVAAKAQNVTATPALLEGWKTMITNSFNAGGLIGTLLTIPAAKYLGRKLMYGVYFLLSSIAVLVAFGAKLPPDLHVWLIVYFALGLTVFGIFGSFTYYLPELFPTRLRATGAGFCYNAGRIITAIGPFLVGYIASGQVNALQGSFTVLMVVGFIPLIGIALLPWVVETRGRVLMD